MDATFGTNEVKYQLFTLMHDLTFITYENLVEWLDALRTNLVLQMPHWKPSYFIMDDAPQEF
jgi:hypothetical protein